ncbi:hypothetical protein F7725_000004 [Dissostichus mawsoni]|uniref:Uncharacterized protein n=2 Tax=Dissostichus mawsoni TaxID=36200 RepID=A0A7J5ZLK4_DISMA|nr:hypothetical protein F7725_000004 [Dissostichus mawsoni]
MSVKVLVMKLVSQIYNKSKENSSLGDPKAVAENLFERVWAKVEGEDFKITPATVKNTDKVIYKELCKQWDGAARVLVKVNEGEQLADDSRKFSVSEDVRHRSGRHSSIVCSLLQTDECGAVGFAGSRIIGRCRKNDCGRADFEVTKTGVSEEYVRSCVGNILPQTFADVLDVKVPDDCDSAKSLTEMIVQEVMESANSVLNARSEGSFAIETEAVQNIIIKEFCGIEEPLLDNMKDTEIEVLKSDTSEWINSISGDIVRSIIEEVNSLEVRDSESPILEPEDMPELCLIGVGTKIKHFFAKQFAKLSIYRMAADMKKKFCPESHVETVESMTSFAEEVEELLRNESEEQKDNEVEVYLGLQNLLEGKSLMFNKMLSDLLFNNTTKGMIEPEIVPGVRRIFVAPPREAILQEIRAKLSHFFGLFGWWMTNQAGSHSDRVEEALNAPDLLTPTDVGASYSAYSSAELGKETSPEVERIKMSVKVLVMKLVSQIYNKSKENSSLGDPKAVAENLFERVWAKVEGEDFKITPATFKNTDKVIYKELCKQWDGAARVLVKVNEGEQLADDVVASIFKYHLTNQPKKRGVVGRFFHAGSSLSVRMSDIAVDDIRPLFVHFCKRMSVEQWDLLDQGSSDDAVKVIVAELILKCVNLVTEAFLAIFKVTKTGVSEEYVRSCVGNILPQTFADVLDVKVPDDCDSAKSLTEMIVQEVMESANSVLNASADNSEEVYRHVTPPNRLGVMVSHACDMLKAFLAKMKGIFRLPERKESQEALIEVSDDGLEEEVTSNKSWQPETSDKGSIQASGDGSVRSRASVTGSVQYRASVGSVQSRASVTGSVQSRASVTGSVQSRASVTGSVQSRASVTRSVQSRASVIESVQSKALSSRSVLSINLGLSTGSEGSFAIETEAVQNIIIKEFCGIEEPLLDNMKDTEIEVLKSDTSEWINSISGDIVRSIIEEVNSLEVRDSESPILEPEDMPELCLIGVGTKIKHFFAKQFAKLSIYRMAADMKKKFCPESHVETVESMTSFAEEVEELLRNESEEQKDNEVEVYLGLQNLLEGKSLMFNKMLSDLLFNNTTKGMIEPEIVPGVRRIFVAPPREAILQEIRAKLSHFFGLFGWWMTNQAGSHSDRVEEALNAPDLLTPTDVGASYSAYSSAELGKETSPEVERIKMSVKVLVMKLVSQIYNKSKENSSLGDPKAVAENLFERVWAKVEGEDFKITPATFKNTDKVIYKELCKQWDGAARVLVKVNEGEQLADDVVASIFKYHLTNQPKKRGVVGRFFHGVGRAIMKPFRRSHAAARTI